MAIDLPTDGTVDAGQAIATSRLWLFHSNQTKPVTSCIARSIHYARLHAVDKQFRNARKLFKECVPIKLCSSREKLLWILCSCINLVNFFSKFVNLEVKPDTRSRGKKVFFYLYFVFVDRLSWFLFGKLLLFVADLKLLFVFCK